MQEPTSEFQQKNTHAEQCPVCFGKGVVDVNYPASTNAGYTRPCHGCGGLGWVKV